MQDVEYTTAVLHALRKMGIRISMDDFGAGYSSLGYLKKFPLHTLKIDRSFVQDLADSPDDLAIISAIITLGQGLNLNVVAEGVETQAQLEQLRSLNCVEMQGFWFSQPLDVKAATQFLKQQTFTSDTHPLLSDPSATHLSALRLDPRTI
jgi:EAL domain-containing protein (putative c-di-GMP-specific phosphodiesterase class I)